VHNEINTYKQIETLAIAASTDEIRRACEWLTTALRQRDVPAPQVERVELVLHEVLANVVAHGGSTARAEPIHIRIEVDESAMASKASVEIRDAGVPFDPTRAPEHIPARTLAETKLGGLGLPQIRHCSDWMSYRRQGAFNHFVFGARW
jgi:anti-sigma regulatory factor (Ser/Thr protein kinase)